MNGFSRRSWRWGLLFAVIACAIVAFGVIWPNRSRVRIDKATCDKIVEGMTEAEVEALIGGPAGDYATPGTCYAIFRGDFPGFGKPSYWSSDEGMIEVYLDNGKVSNRYFWPAWTSTGWLERIRQAFGL